MRLLKKKKISTGDVFIYSFLTLFGITTVYPFLNIIAVSLTTYENYVRKPWMIWPGKFIFSAYKAILSNNFILSAYFNTIFITAVGAAISVLLTIMTAYPLSRKHMKYRNVILTFIVITMLFYGGMIPTYLLVQKLGLTDTLWALILPTAINAYYTILMKNFFNSIPESIEESAKIDGANDIYILFKIMVPLALPAIATFALFYAVLQWNSFYSAVIYITDRKKWTLQLLLREVIVEANVAQVGNMPDEISRLPQSMKMATVVVTTFPILILYPFVQKYFVKGVMVGAVKQ